MPGNNHHLWRKGMKNKMTKVTLKNFTENTKGIYDGVGRAATPYQAARKVARGIFTEHKCYKYDITPDGIVGTYPNGDTVLLERSTVEGLVLSCITDLMMRELHREFEDLIDSYDAGVRARALAREKARFEAEVARIRQKKAEAADEVQRHRGVIDHIKGAIYFTQRTIEQMQEEILRCKERKDDLKELLRPFNEADELTKIEALRGELKQLYEKLAIEEPKLRDADQAYNNTPDAPNFDAENAARLIGQ